MNFSFHLSISGENLTETELHAAVSRLTNAVGGNLQVSVSNEVGTIEQGINTAFEESQPEATTEAAPAAAPNYTRFGINVYDSESEVFALGKKVYANADEASEKRTRNGNWTTSFNLDIDLIDGRFERNDAREDDDVRYFAVYHANDGESISLSKGYDTHAEAADANEGALAVIGVALDDASNVAVF